MIYHIYKYRALIFIVLFVTAVRFLVDYVRIMCADYVRIMCGTFVSVCAVLLRVCQAHFSLAESSQGVPCSPICQTSLLSQRPH